MIGGSTPILDNRELALVIWLLALLTFGLLSKRMRPSFISVFKALAAPKIIFVIALMAAYAGLLVYLLYLGNIWTWDLVSETLFWFFGPAIVLFSRFDKAGQDPRFFRRTLVTAIELTVLIEFLVNVYPLSLIAELFLVPVFVLIGGMVAVASTKKEYRQVKAFLDVILVLIGLSFLGYAIYRIVEDPQGFPTFGTLREFSVPILLTVALLPFVYAMAVFATYEIMFLRLRWKLKDGKLLRYAKWRVFRAALFRLRTITRFASAYPSALTDRSSRADVDRVVNEIQRSRLAQ